MNQVIKNILERKCTQQEKEQALMEIEKDIEMARKVISGFFRYCPQCGDYYLADSFLKSNTSEPTKMLTYEDPINSGGNEYCDGIKYVKQLICPKGHRLDISETVKKVSFSGDIEM